MLPVMLLKALVGFNVYPWKFNIVTEIIIVGRLLSF